MAKAGKAWEHLSHEWCLMDTRWTWRCLTTSMCTINLRASFLPVKCSTCNLVNIWGLVYWWSTWWRNLVLNFTYLNADPSPLTSTSHPPDVIHVIRFPGFPFFTLLFCFCVLYWMQTKEQKQNRSGNVWIHASYCTIIFVACLRNEDTCMCCLIFCCRIVNIWNSLMML